jgi:hypothetical protein
MKIRNILALILVTSLVFVSCNSREAINPFDSRNALGNDGNASLPYSISRGVDSKSKEGNDHVNFKWGEHTGELNKLDFSIEYLDHFGTIAGGYVIYYIGVPMRYRITIKNTSDRNFGHLEVIAIQEYHETKTCNRWWYPYPQSVSVEKGDPMPGDAIQVWEDVYLGPNSEVVLEDTYTAPIQTCSGLDQTHLILKHYNQGELHAAVMYDNPELGVFDPPPPAE